MRAAVLAAAPWRRPGDARDGETGTEVGAASGGDGRRRRAGRLGGEGGEVATMTTASRGGRVGASVEPPRRGTRSRQDSPSDRGCAGPQGTRRQGATMTGSVSVLAPPWTLDQRRSECRRQPVEARGGLQPSPGPPATPAVTRPAPVRLHAGTRPDAPRDARRHRRDLAAPPHRDASRRLRRPHPTPRPTSGPGLAISSVARRPAKAAAADAAASINAFGFDCSRAARRPAARARKEERRLLADEHRPRPRHGRAPEQGDTPARWTPFLHTTGWDAWGRASTASTRRSPRGTGLADEGTEHALALRSPTPLRAAGLEDRTALPRAIGSAFGQACASIDFRTDAKPPNA